MKLTSGGAAGMLVSSGTLAQDSKSKNKIQVENSGLPYRQIHLDFHTSRHISGIGSEFDPEYFLD